MRLHTLLPLLALLSSSAAYKFLVIFPVPSPSQGIMGKAIVSSLIEANHEVMYITPFPEKHMRKDGLHQVDVSFMVDGMKAAMPNFFALGEENFMSNAKEMALNFTISLLKSDAVQKVLSDKTLTFDAVISQWFFSDVHSGFSQVFQCPYILFSSVGMNPIMEYLVDEVQSPASNPFAFTVYTVPMSLKERIYNSAIVFGVLLYNIFIEQPKEALIYQEYFGPAAESRGIQLRDYTEAIHDVSMLLLNSHPSYGPATRLPSNAVEIGGFHIDEKPKQLPKNLQELLDKATDGVIYFSMGSNLKSKDMPEEMRNSLLEMFGRFPQTVLWKFEADMKNAPKNVHIRRWMPQQSILAHKNLKVFITHGGLSSTTEAIHFGKPIIAIPVFGDQHNNAIGAVKKGYGLMAELKDPNFVHTLEEALNKMLEDPRYGDTVSRLSQLYHDRPVPPARLVSYWSEHVARTGGAPHLRSAASLVPAYQRYLLDILAIIVGIILFLAWLLRALFRLVFTTRLKTKPNNVRTSKSKKKFN